MSTTIRKVLTAVAKSVAPGVFDVTLSTSTLDREQDRVLASGWRLSSRTRVPLLWSHKHDHLPMGVVTDLFVNGEALQGRMTFTPRGLNPFADSVSDLIQAGFLTTVSVGFRPLDPPVANADGGYTYRTNELLELSVVNIPAAPTATIEASAFAAVRKWMAEPADDVAVMVSEDDSRDLTDLELPLTEAELRDAIASATREAIDEHLGQTGTKSHPELIHLPITEGEMRDAIAEAVTESWNAATGRVD